MSISGEWARFMRRVQGWIDWLRGKDKDGGGSGGGGKVPAFDSFAPLAGRVWGWGPVNRLGDYDPNAAAAACVEFGARVLHIEFIKWIGTGLPDLNATKLHYAALLEACRRRRVTLFVSSFNDNAHLSKHGRVGRATPKKYLEQVAAIILAYGPEGVVVQPVGETQTEVGKWFEQHWKAVGKGFPLVYNGGSRPTRVPSGYKYAAYHPRSTSDTFPAGLVAVTDTGTILHELGLYSGTGNPAKCAAWAKRMLARGNPPIFYQFKSAAIPTAMLAAVQAAVG